MKADLSGVPETMLIPLWARAEEARKPNPIFRDDKASELVSTIDYDFARFEKAWRSQVGVAVRTILLDNAVRAFLARNPDAVIVNLGAGLDTRYTRLGAMNVLWYDLDLPEAIELRRRFFAETEGYRLLPKSMLDPSWMDEIREDGRSVLLIAEGLFMYFAEDELRPLFKTLVARFPGAEMLFEMLPMALVGKSKRHDSVTKIGSAVDFKWALKNSREMTEWHPDIEFVEEWNYFDFHKDRWRWFGLVARLPFLRSSMAPRIVHLRFRTG